LLGDDILLKTMKLLAGDELEIPDDELLRMTLSAVRSDYKAVETYRYRPGPPLATPIVALTGDNDPRVTPAEAELWAQYTSATCELRVFEGGHFYLVHHLEQIIELLRSTFP
jgi:pyochelin biosynthesis protein PchC